LRSKPSYARPGHNQEAPTAASTQSSKTPGTSAALYNARNLAGALLGLGMAVPLLGLVAAAAKNILDEIDAQSSKAADLDVAVRRVSNAVETDMRKHFGLSKSDNLLTQTSHRTHRAGRAAGTLAYMAPELLDRRRFREMRRLQFRHLQLRDHLPRQTSLTLRLRAGTRTHASGRFSLTSRNPFP